jgi:hypothetical protein
MGHNAQQDDEVAAERGRDRDDNALHRYQAAFAQDWLTLWHAETQQP